MTSRKFIETVFSMRAKAIRENDSVQYSILVEDVLPEVLNQLSKMRRALRRARK